MTSPPPNPDTRELPYGWMQQYNWEYRQWFYVNARENPPRSSWEHPMGPMPQGFAPPPGPSLDRSYNRSPYAGPSPQAAGYGGGYQSSYAGPPQGYLNAPQGGYPQGGYVGGAPYGSDTRGYNPQRQPEIVYVEEQRKPQKKGFGLGTAALAGGGGLLAGALLTEAFEDHNEREREEGYDQGYEQGYDQGYDQGDGFF